MKDNLVFFLILISALFTFTSKSFAADTFHFWHHNDFSGNDYGFTGSMNFDIEVPQENGFAVTYRYYTSLYTQRVIPYGDPEHPQYAVFTDWQHVPADFIAEPKGVQDERIDQNTTASITVSRNLPSSWFSWSIEGGLTQTESRSAYFPGMAEIQLLFHKLIGATKYNIISDGKPSTYGAFLKPMGSAHASLINAPDWKLQSNLVLGGSFDTDDRRTYLQISTGFQIGAVQNVSSAGTLLQLNSVLESQLSARHKQLVLREELNLNFSDTTLTLGVAPVLTNTGYTEGYDSDYVDQDLIYHVGVTVIL
jgi:hypothetical protein